MENIDDKNTLKNHRTFNPFSPKVRWIFLLFCWFLRHAGFFV
ncbi:Sel1 [Aggregatibacter aphrophilus NJ8700]|nr:Sel1 [Aggregatibacter aphrophilus NJ8700]